MRRAQYAAAAGGGVVHHARRRGVDHSIGRAEPAGKVVARDRTFGTETLTQPICDRRSPFWNNIKNAQLPYPTTEVNLNDRSRARPPSCSTTVFTRPVPASQVTTRAVMAAPPACRKAPRLGPSAAANDSAVTGATVPLSLIRSDQAKWTKPGLVCVGMRVAPQCNLRTANGPLQPRRGTPKQNSVQTRPRRGNCPAAANRRPWRQISNIRWLIPSALAGSVHMVSSRLEPLDPIGGAAQ
jgi:hypothetical protein